MAEQTASDTPASATAPPAVHGAAATEARPRRRRRELPWPVRTLVVASMGALLAVAVSYLLRKAGF